MSEEFKNDEQELQEQQQSEEVVDAKDEQETIEESKPEEEAKEEAVVAEEELKEDVKPEGKDEEEPIKEEEKKEKEEENAVEEPEEVKEESPAEEIKEEKVEAKVVEEEAKEAPLPQVENVEDVKKQLAEKEAELEEEKAIKAYESDVREANRQLDDFLVNLGNAMAQEFAKYGIDVNTNLDELKKSDPAKAQVAENIIRQAQAVKEQAMRNVNNNLNDRLTDVVFNKAARLFDKFELTQEQSMLAAETFVNILEQTGVKDIGEDLVAKVELAAARAKMLKPKAEKVIEEVKEIVEETKDAVKEVIEEKQTPDEVKAEVKEEEKEEQEETPVVESIVEAPTLDEFKEGAVTSNQAAGDSVTVDNVLDKMASLPFKDRVRFYADHKELAEEAMAKKSNAESKRKRI